MGFVYLQAEKNRAAAMANNLQKGSAGPMRLYVGSLHFNITEDMLRGIFEPFGRVNFSTFFFPSLSR